MIERNPITHETILGCSELGRSMLGASWKGVKFAVGAVATALCGAAEVSMQAGQSPSAEVPTEDLE